MESGLVLLCNIVTILCVRFPKLVLHNEIFCSMTSIYFSYPSTPNNHHSILCLCEFHLFRFHI